MCSFTFVFLFAKWSRVEEVQKKEKKERKKAKKESKGVPYIYVLDSYILANICINLL